MWRVRISCAFFVIFVVFFPTQSVPARTLEQNKLEGQVLDRKNNRLAGVLVRLYRGSKPLPNPVRTDRDGFYSISFDSGDPISLVRYDLTNWYPSRVENISGVRDHRINKVLLESGADLSAQEFQEVMTTFVTLRAIDLANGEPPDKFQAQYGSAINALAHQRREHSPHMMAFIDFGSFRKQLYADGPDIYRMSPSHVGNMTLLEITKSSAERVGSNPNSIRVSVEARTGSAGWEVSTFRYVLKNVLHVYVVGQPPSDILSKTAATFSISEIYDNLPSVTRAVFHGTGGEVIVELNKDVLVK